MIFAHEWVQIKDGTIGMVRLADDLSRTVREPMRLFHGSERARLFAIEDTGDSLRISAAFP